MRAVRIEPGKFLVGGKPVDLGTIKDKKEFLAGLLTLDVELSDDINAAELFHFFYYAQDLIRSILSEEYEAVRAMVMSSNLRREYKEIRIYKSFTIERDSYDSNEYLYLSPEIEFVLPGVNEDGVKNISGLPVVIDENVKLNHEEGNTILSSRVKFTLMDLMVCLFDELPAELRNGSLIA
jgi:hypothetical protein